MDTQETERKDEIMAKTGSSPPKADGHAIAALVLGIVAVISPFQLFGVGGLVGIILGVIGLYQVSMSARRGENSLAHSGKVLSIIGLVISALALIATIIMLVRFSGMVSSYMRFPSYNFRPTMMHRFWF
ncbi:MAG: DUF4190 domain-containing protein [Sphaerochaetaceae bacterium]